MTAKAIEQLKSHPNGFVIQVEGGKVDWAAHGNDIGALLYDQVAFDEAVKVALDFAKADGNTLVVITSDHGNANPGLIYGKECNNNFDRLQNFTHSNDWILQQINPNDSIDKVREHIAQHCGGMNINEEQAKELVKELESKEEAIFAPTLSLDRLKELHSYLKNKEDNLQSIRVYRAIEKYETSKSILKPFMLSIIESYPDFFEQNDFWKKYKSMVLDTNIEWLMVKEVTELKEITEAYDITCPPYCTFVMENGIVVYDTVSFNSVVTKESVKEIDNLLASKSFYITPDGKLTYSAETDTLNYVLKHLSK